MKQLGFQRRSLLSDEDLPRGAPPSISWDLSLLVAGAAVIILGLALLVPVARQSERIRPVVDSLIPAAWWEAIGLGGGAKKEVGQTIPERAGSAWQEVKPDEASKTFGIGSSQEDVRRAQGSPTLIENGTWFYGESKVVFAHGRVITWTSTAGRPLRTR